MHRRPAHPTDPPNWYGSHGCTGCLPEVCGACVPYDPRMFEWPEELQMVRDAVRQFVDNEIRPHREELEFGDVPPYAVLRKMFQTFGLDALAREQFKKRIERERTAAEAAKGDAAEAATGDAAEGNAASGG